MSVVSLLGVKVLNNPAKFTDPYEFEITFECLEQLQKDLEWKLTYVGSATSSEHDQELDSLLVGPIPVGVNKFIFEADPPDPKKIISSEILGVTVILLTCAYDDREFVRVGYYVNNEYDSDELNNEPPSKPVIERVRRNILAEKPRVTRFAIKWDSEDSAPAEYPPDQPEADNLDDDERNYGAEEAEMQQALEQEYEEVEKEIAAETAANPVGTGASGVANGNDAEMAGTDAPKDKAANADDGVDSDAESEDLEAESSGSEDEEDEEGEAEGEEPGEGEDVEMGDDAEAKSGEQRKGGVNGTAASSEVMVH